jgi:hypothetical protein
MFDINQPASAYILDNSLERPRGIYTVVSQLKNEVTVRVQTDPLNVGQTLLFDSEVVGVVIRTSGNLAFVMLSTEKKVTQAEMYKWVEPTPKRIIFREFGSLSVKCRNAGTKELGEVGWTLRGTDRRIIAVGNDIDKLHTCEIEGSGLWTPGVYHLEVMNYTKARQPLGRFGRMTWTITEGNTLSVLTGENSDSRSSNYLVLS